MFRILTASTVFASFVISSAPLVAQGTPQVDAKAWPSDTTGMTRTVVGDTLLVECHPETVAPKRRTVAVKPRTAASKGPRVRRKLRKAPGATTIQVCRETRLPGKPTPKPTVVAPPAEALGPLEGPQVASEAGALPPEGVSGPVGGGHTLSGGAITGVPLVFLAFLHHGNDHNNEIDNGVIPGVPTPPVTPPITSTPEPSSLALLASGLVGLGAAVKRRRR